MEGFFYTKIFFVYLLIMKEHILIIGSMFLLGFIGCKKKEANSNDITQTPITPFVEYRDSFTGVYKGTEYTSQDVNYNGTQMPPDSVTNFNVLDTIIKSTTNDSNIISKRYHQEFHISATGKWNYKNPSNYPLELYNFRYRNDSIYFYRLKTLHSGPNNYYYTFIFNGKKQ